MFIKYYVYNQFTLHVCMIQQGVKKGNVILIATMEIFLLNNGITTVLV